MPVNRRHKRILIVLGIIVLVSVTGLVAEYAGSFAFFVTLPIALVIF